MYDNLFKYHALEFIDKSDNSDNSGSISNDNCRSNYKNNNDNETNDTDNSFPQTGVSRHLFERWCDDERNGVVLAGYTVEGTLAHDLLNHPTGKSFKEKLLIL